MSKFFIFFWLIVAVCRGQIFEYDKLTLKITPTSLATPLVPAFQAGIEYRPTIDFGVQTDFASNLGTLRYYPPCLFCSGQKTIANNYKIRTEGRWYFTPERKNTFFWAQEVFAIASSFSHANSFARRDSIFYKISLAHVQNLTLGFATKIGYLFRMSTRLRGEAYVGVGIRYNKRTASIDREERLVHVPDLFWENLYDLNQEAQTTILPHLSIGFRVGYVLIKAR